MNRRQKGSICFLAIIGMLVLGMCFERIGADSFLAYDTSRPLQQDVVRETFLDSVGGIPLCGQTYLKDTYGTQEVAAVIRHAARRWMDRSHRTGNGSLWQPAWVLARFPDRERQALCADGSVPGLSRHIIIVSYIHQKDGKKAFLSSFIPNRI